MKEIPQKVKGFSRKRLALTAAAVVAAAGIAAAVLLSRGSGRITAEVMAKPVVVCEEFSLDNTALNYYYWSKYFYLVGVFGDQLPDSLDPSQPLEEQRYDAEQTWQDYLLDQTMVTIRDTLSMVFAAQEAGFTMDQSYVDSMETVVDGLAEDAAQQGYDDVTAYLTASYGPGATEESFRAYLSDTYLAAAYTDALYQQLQFTDQEIADYCALHADDYARLDEDGGETRLRNAYILLCKPTENTEEAWAEAESSARTLYATWQAESGTETDFAALADAHSAAPALRQDLSPADCSGELGEWLFDPERAAGDTEVLRSDEGWNVVYCLEPSADTVWMKQAAEDLRKETYESTVRTIQDQYEFLVNYDAIRLVTPASLTANDG